MFLWKFGSCYQWFYSRNLIVFLFKFILQLLCYSLIVIIVDIVQYCTSRVVDICASCAEAAAAGNLSQVWYFKLNFMSRIDETCKKHCFELVMKPLLNYNMHVRYYLVYKILQYSSLSVHTIQFVNEVGQNVSKVLYWTAIFLF